MWFDPTVGRLENRNRRNRGFAPLLRVRNPSASRRRAPDSGARAVASALGGVRAALGVGALLVTGPALRLLGFDAADGRARALTRLAGSRDLALGALALVALEDARALRAITLTNAGVDAADAGTFLVALIRRDGIDRAAALGAGSATAASALGFLLAERLR